MPDLSPPTLTESEQRAIPQATASNPRDYVIYSLALGTGLLSQRLGSAHGAAASQVNSHVLGKSTGSLQSLPCHSSGTWGLRRMACTSSQGGTAGQLGDIMDSRSGSVEFFERQFRRQVQEQDFALNPFETLAVDYLAGEVLDLGCGLGNLSLEGARRGCTVTAIDASPTAVVRIQQASLQESLNLQAVLADLETYTIERDYDTIVAIGLLMFFRRGRALELLEDIRERVRPGGRAVVNLLVEGTTFTDMFDPGNHCLFGREELREHFADWRVLVWRPETYQAPKNTVKEFTTLVAEKPGVGRPSGPPQV